MTSELMIVLAISPGEEGHHISIIDPQGPMGTVNILITTKDKYIVVEASGWLRRLCLWPEQKEDEHEANNRA